MFAAFLLMSALNHLKSNQQNLILFYSPHDTLSTILTLKKKKNQNQGGKQTKIFMKVQDDRVFVTFTLLLKPEERRISSYNVHRPRDQF